MPTTPAAATDDREVLAAAPADHVRRVVDGFPPLTGAQRGQLALLLQDDGTAGND